MRSHIPYIKPGIMIHEYFGVPAMNNFRFSLSIAEAALEMVRRAAHMAEAVKETDQIERLHEAETLAEQVYEELKKRYVYVYRVFRRWLIQDSSDLGPVGGCVQRHMGGRNDEEMRGVERILSTGRYSHCATNQVQNDWDFFRAVTMSAYNWFRHPQD